jgi:hypothetical protein
VKRSTVVLVVIGVGVTAALTVLFDVSFGKAAIAVLVIGVLLRIGWAVLASLSELPPEPPDPGTLRKVKLTYQCQICGAEVRMTVAASEDPEPPRHCLDEMVLLTPVE